MRSLRMLVIIVAILFVATYILVAVARVVYPYDIDFLEDSMLMQSLRIAQAQPIYIPVSIEFVPHVYMPLYLWLGGLLLKITGPSFVPLRLMSFAATLATAAMIYQVARRESGQRWVAMASAGLWLGGYRITAGWYELARVDSLFVALTLGGFALGIYASKSTRGMMLSAIVLGLATLTKQTGVVFASGLAIYLLMTVGRRVWLFVGVYSALVVLPLIILNAASDGWFNFYTFGIASSNPIEVGRLVDYIRFELFGLTAALTAMAIAAAWLNSRRTGLAAIREQPWLIGIGAAIAVSGLGRASVGGATNNLMPVYALLCLAPSMLMREWTAAPGLGDTRQAMESQAASSPFVSRLLSSARRWRVGLLAIAIVIQFGLGMYNPFRFVPGVDMRQSGDRLIERIASVDGEVWVMQHPYYALLAGKQPSAQIAIVWHSRERGVLPLPDDLVRRIQSRYYAAIISDESLFEIDPPLAELIAANYVRSEVLTEADAPPTLTGMAVRPTVVYVPKK